MFQIVLNICTLLGGITALFTLWEKFASLRVGTTSAGMKWQSGNGAAGGLLGGLAWFGWGLIGVAGVFIVVIASGVLTSARAPRLRTAAQFAFRTSYFAVFWVTIEFCIAIILLVGVGGYTEIGFLKEPLVRTYPGLATAAVGGVVGWFLEQF